MTKNPYLNALAAVAYICVVASVMFYGAQHKVGQKDTVLAPIAFISVFSVSAAMMGYIFLFQPAQLYLDGKKKVAASLFVRTLLTFALITALFVTLFFSGVLK